ncbi:hypothetical protein ABZW30_23945 [Kitasatospora sp. NPDC004669]|uniref:hypothetical protein n=1 Tax=Kitasatospora sp. NPDC004669 TaxID=3154555 RepID=UPI0033B056F3
MTEPDEGTAGRRFLRPRLVVPAAMAALLLVGGSVWALSGGGGSTAPVGAGTSSAVVSPTAEPSPTATPTPTPTVVETPTEAPASPSPTATPEPVPASAEPAADEPGGDAPTATRKPATKAPAAPAAPAAKSQGDAAAAKPKAPSGIAPHNEPPVACTDCATKRQGPDPDATCIHDAAGKVLTCSPTQVGTPILRPGQSMGTPTPGWPDHTH